MSQSITKTIAILLAGACCFAPSIERAHAQTSAPDSVVTDSLGTNAAPVDTIAAPAHSAAVVDTAESGVPQRDVFDVLFHDILHRPVKHKERKEGLHWSLLPTFSYNTVYGFAFGAMVAVAGQLRMSGLLTMVALESGKASCACRGVESNTRNTSNFIAAPQPK